MARIVALIPDLLFGSRVVSALQAAGHRVELRADFDDAGDADLLVVDLTSEPADRIARLSASPTPKLAFYSHVETDVRAQAEQAGFDLVVPRSRMAREGGALVNRLLAAS